jgi:hypothetical protein
MLKVNSFRIQRLRIILFSSLLFGINLVCPNSWAAQEAYVLSDKALIYSDIEMTSPVGYVVRGKKIIIGEVVRNKGRVYPITVSGRIAYIRAADVSTEKGSVDSGPSAERFFKNTQKLNKSKFVASYFFYHAAITQSAVNTDVKNGELFLWHGLSVRGDILMKRRLDVHIAFNFLTTTNNLDTYRAFEFGPGVTYRLIDRSQFHFRWDAQLLAIPFVTYEVGGQFRKRSFGFSTGTGPNFTWLWNEQWGLEASGGLFFQKFLQFDLPAPYKDNSVSFVGYRAYLGLNYSY